MVDDDGQTWGLEVGEGGTSAPGVTRRPMMPEDRYALGEPLGEGGFSVVHRVEDRVLERDVAMKLLKPTRLHVSAIGRFENAARICARLSHQAIVQIFDVGVWPDGRPFLTMPIVSGRTLSAVIAAEHARMDREGRLDVEGLRRMVTFVRVACDALAYAHEQEVLHRDVKPGNIMVSDYNEVIVLDWGLARHQRDRSLPLLGVDPEPATSTSTATRTGSVQGTTGYMAPEQAQGRTHDIDPRTDVFALGAVLYEVLTSQPPWGRDGAAALAAAAAGEPRMVPPRPGLPEALSRICERALRIDPAERYPDARAMSEALADWLVGLEASRHALSLVRDSDRAVAQARGKRAAAQERSARAQALLVGVAPAAAESDKHAGWAEEDRAVELLREAELLDIEQVQLLQTALSFADLPAAHRRLADIYHDRHRQAEVVGDRHAADRFAYLLEAHSRGRYDDYLRGVGWLTLETSRPVTVRLSRYVPRHRRLWPEPVGVWPAPLASVELPIGSYLAELVTEEGACYRLPLEIRRSEGTTGALAPGGPPVAVWIPQPGAVPEGTVYVPAGPLWSGGGEGVFGASLPLRRVWVEGFFIDRFPVTNARYLDFLNTLVAEGRAAAAAAHCPRERAAGGGEGRAVYGLDGQGRYVLVSDGDGDVWDPQWPVVSLTIASARAFAAWRTAVTGRVHRLPFELEWEKAARGADRRSRVWGTDAIDPTWCRIGMSAGAGRSQPVPVGDCPADESPYGVRGLAGNVSDICGDHYTREGSPVVDGRWQVQPTPTGLHPLRGAAWNAHPSRTHIGVRGGISANGRSSLCGFRLVVPLDGPAR